MRVSLIFAIIISFMLFIVLQADRGFTRSRINNSVEYGTNNDGTTNNLVLYIYIVRNVLGNDI